MHSTAPYFPEPAPAETRIGVVTDLLPSGAAFVTFADGRQAFLLRSLVQRMQLGIGTRVDCTLVANFPNHLSEQVPWRAVHVVVLSSDEDPANAPLSPKSTSSLTFGGLQDAVMAILCRNKNDTVWSEDDLLERLPGVDVSDLRRALSALQAKQRVSRACVYGAGTLTRNFWSVNFDDLLPVGMFEDEGDD